MEHVALVTKKLRLAIDLSQTCNEYDYFVNTVDQPEQIEKMLLNKNCQGLFWDVASFPFAKNQPQLTQLRHDYQIPILMLAEDKADTLPVIKAGFDDYLTAPYDYHVLVARLQQKQALYARLHPLAKPKSGSQQANYVIDDVVIDKQKYKVLKQGHDLGLTPKELKLLLYLVERSPQVLSRQQLLEGVWGDIYDLSQTSRMVDIHISHLRDKIEPDPQHPQYIKTVRGFGYNFVGAIKKEA